MNFKDYTIDKFLYELKTDLSSPGGGSTAALVSALAGALNNMVYSFTVDKKAFEKLDDKNKEKMLVLKEKCEEFISKSIAATIASDVKFLFPNSIAKSILS